MEVISQFICKTQDLGVNDNLFGGVLMSRIDEYGALFACQKALTSKMVTLKFTELVFMKPVKLSDIVKVYGEVTGVGTSSMTINLEARKQNVRNDEEQIVCKTQAVFVRIDENDRPIALPKQVLENYK